MIDPFEKFADTGRLDMDWRRLLIQGIAVMLIGFTLILASVVKSDVIILFSKQLSWLPASGAVIMAMGLLECLDAFLAGEARDFLQNLQVGVLDIVVGALIFLNVDEDPARLVMMLAAFLLVRGIVRIALTFALRLPHPVWASLGGVLTIILGLMVCFGWPNSEGWFLSLCMNVEIAIRGWAVIVFAFWVRKRKSEDTQSDIFN